jgi:hypothetical protein
LNSSLRTAPTNETPYIQETASAVDSGVLVTKYINNEICNQNPRKDSFIFIQKLDKLAFPC